MWNDDNVFGFIVNPKDGVLCYARMDGTDVECFTFRGEVAGMGDYYDRGEHYTWTADVTGYPRCHTAGAVPEALRYGGYGTVLYTALSLGALCKAKKWRDDGPEMHRPKPGVSSSMDSRSKLANEWWDRAIRIYGLAERNTYEVESEEDQEESDTLRYRDSSSRFDSDLLELVSSYYNESIVKLDDFTIEYTKSVERGLEAREADIYPAENAVKRHLIGCAFDDAGERQLLDPETLLAADYGAFTTKDWPLLQHILSMLGEAGVSGAEIEKAYLRAVLGIDEDTTVWEQLGKYAETFHPLHANPRVVQKRGHVKTKPQLLVPAVDPGVKVKVYPRKGVRRNPEASPALVRELVEDLHERRRKLGWAVFAADKKAP